jgi:hypothetical protein
LFPAVNFLTAEYAVVSAGTMLSQADKNKIQTTVIMRATIGSGRIVITFESNKLII